MALLVEKCWTAPIRLSHCVGGVPTGETSFSLIASRAAQVTWQLMFMGYLLHVYSSNMMTCASQSSLTHQIFCDGFGFWKGCKFLSALKVFFFLCIKVEIISTHLGAAHFIGWAPKWDEGTNISETLKCARASEQVALNLWRFVRLISELLIRRDEVSRHKSWLVNSSARFWRKYFIPVAGVGVLQMSFIIFVYFVCILKNKVFAAPLLYCL